MWSAFIISYFKFSYFHTFNFHTFFIPSIFILSCFRVGVYWVVGLIPEDLELSRNGFTRVQLNSSFLQNFQLDILWPDLNEEQPQLEQTLVCASKFHDLKKGILRTVRFRFEMTTISNLEKQWSKACQIARLWVRVPGLVSFGWKDLNTCCQGFWGSKRSFVSQHLIRIRAQNRFELPTFETNSVWVPPSNWTGRRLGNQSQK